MVGLIFLWIKNHEISFFHFLVVYIFPIPPSIPLPSKNGPREVMPGVVQRNERLANSMFAKTMLLYLEQLPGIVWMGFPVSSPISQLPPYHIIIRMARESINRRLPVAVSQLPLESSSFPVISYVTVNVQAPKRIRGYFRLCIHICIYVLRRPPTDAVRNLAEGGYYFYYAKRKLLFIFPRILGEKKSCTLHGPSLISFYIKILPYWNTTW